MSQTIFHCVEKMNSLEECTDALLHSIKDDWSRIEDEWIFEVLPHDDDWFSNEDDVKDEWSRIDQWIFETILGDGWESIFDDDDWDVQVGGQDVSDDDEVNVGASTSKRGANDDDDNDDDDDSQNSKRQKTNDNFYVIEKVNEVKCKKFKTKAMDYRGRFNNKNTNLNLIQEYERTQKIFERLIRDVSGGMKGNDQVRFVLRTPQLNTPISLPFLPASHFTPERIYAQIERVVQSNQDFTLDDSVVVDILHVDMPSGSLPTKRRHVDLQQHLRSKHSIVTIKNNDDDMCLARALVVAIAKIEKDPEYFFIKDSRSALQRKRAKELHEKAKVPLGQCGIPEVKMFQEYLTAYEINIVSADHGDVIIYPHAPTQLDVKPMYLYLHNKH